MIKNEGGISEENDRGVVSEELFQLHYRIHNERSVDAKKFLDQFLSVQGIINSLVSLVLVLDLLKHLSVPHHREHELVIMHDCFLVILHVSLLKQLHIHWVSIFRQRVVHLSVEQSSSESSA